VNPHLRIKVLLLVGNRLLYRSLVSIIQQRSDIFVSQESAALSDIALLIARSESDVILLDAVSTNTLNRQGVTRMRDLNPNAQVLLVGMDEDEGAFLRAVRAGVGGYLLHEATAVDVVAAIQGLARRQAICPPRFCRALFDALAGAREITPAVQKMGIRLSRRERELLVMVARGLTNKEISSLLNLSVQTVKNQMHRMLRKIGASDRLAALEIARAEGFPINSCL
jgi:DNA-binding NarL/FixJ family response regulator